MSDPTRKLALHKLQAFAVNIIGLLASTYRHEESSEDEHTQEAGVGRPKRDKPQKLDPLVVQVARSRTKPQEQAHRDLEDDSDNSENTEDKLRKTSIVCPRAKGQRELAMILRIVDASQLALRRGTNVTKRDIFYRDVNLFKTQAAVDRLVDDLAVTLEVSRSSLNIVAAAKGLVRGRLDLLLDDGSQVSARQAPVLIPVGEAVADVVVGLDVRFVLVVEKEAVFSSLLNLNFTDDSTLGPSLLITGKGYPDHATRRLLRLLASKLPPFIPFLCLVDADPHGIDIMSTYRFGSSNRAFASEDLAVDNLTWIGVKGSDWDDLELDRDSLLKLEPSDRKRALSLLSRADLPNDWVEELCIMLHRGRKAETQILEGGKLAEYLRTRVAVELTRSREPSTTTAPARGGADDLMELDYPSSVSDEDMLGDPRIPGGSSGGDDSNFDALEFE